jgi:hypothetical protein
MPRININLKQEHIDRLDKFCMKINMNRGQALRLIFGSDPPQVDMARETLLDMINSLFGGEYNALERKSATGDPGKMERINVNLETENIERLDKVCKHMNMNRGQVVRLIFSGVENQIDLAMGKISELISK